MAFPKPEPGLVIHYSYLWEREYLAGKDEGTKDRPCAIVVAIQTDGDGEERVLVLPITHSAPADPRLSIEIPPSIKKSLGLDDGRSWIVLSEVNEFAWPGPDLRPIPGKPDGSVVHGFLPPKFFATVKQRLVALATSGELHRVGRTA